MKIAHGFALACVAVTSVFIMWMIWWLTGLLSDRSWCFTALGAGSGAGAGSDGFTACVGLLTIQIRALAESNVIMVGVIALCLLALMIIVVAQGKMNLDVGKDGAKINLGKDVDPLQSGDTVSLEKVDQQ